MNLGRLKAAVARRLGREDAMEAPLGDYIAIAQDRIARQVRIPSLEVATTREVDAEGAILLPGDIVYLRHLYVEDRQLVASHIDLFRRGSQSAGPPLSYMQVGQKVYFAPTPAEGTTIGVVYYRADDAMVSDTDESVIARAAPDALIYGALFEAAVDFNDLRADQFRDEFIKRADELALQASEFYHSLGPVFQATYHEDF